MYDTPKTLAAQQRFGWLSFPLLIFAASRALLFAFAKSGPLFGPAIGADGSIFAPFSRAYPALAALGHGQLADYARIARNGYAGAADAAITPVVPLLGKWLGAALGSIELGLMVLSLLACALGFVGLYRLFERLRGTETARWGVALLAAFPLSYHLSDGSAVGCLLAFSTWGAFFALQGSAILAAVVLSVGALAHPACAILAMAVIPMASQGEQPRLWRRILIAIAPILACLGWFSAMSSRLGPPGAGLRAAFFVHPTLVGSGWKAVAIASGAFLGVGVLLLLRMRGLRSLSLVGALYLSVVLMGWNSVSAFALSACWPAFLGLGDLLAKRQSLRGPVVAMLCAHQGLLLYCFTHFLRSS